MDADLALITAQQRGFFLRSQALDAGYSERELTHHVRSREWHRLRRGAHAPHEVIAGLDAAGRHVLTARTVLAQLGGSAVLTSYSALAALSVPVWGVDLDSIHVHRGPRGTSRREAGLVHHVGPLDDADIVEQDGLRLVRGAVSLLDAIRTVAFDPGVVLADGAMRQLGIEPQETRELLEERRDWAGSINASRVLRFADGRAQTVGESRARLLMARIGITPSHLQYPVMRSDGRQIAVVDLYVEDIQTAVEFDGRLKYGRELYEKADPETEVRLGEVVWREKRREDSIRDEGHEVVRIVWSELDGHDALLAQRFRKAADRARRYRPVG